jgi:hypothetical protein
LADFHSRAVVSDDFEFFDIVIRLAGHYGVDAAGIVSDHATDGAAVVAGGIGREGQVIFLGGVAQIVEDDAGLHAGDATLRIDLDDLGHVPGKIQNDGDVAALAGERGPAAAAEKGRGKFAAHGNCGENVIGIPRKDDADWNLAVVRSVGRVEGAAAVVKADISTYGRAQSFRQSRSVSS